MSTAPSAIARRTVCYTSLDEILADAERIAAAPYQTAGEWHYGQILNHLATAIDMTFDGFGFQSPWYARMLIAPLMKKRFLHQPMPAGFKLPPHAASLLPPPTSGIDEELDHLRRSLARLKSDTPSAPHPFLGRLTKEEVVLLTLRHCELHLSFVVPEDAASEEH